MRVFLGPHEEGLAARVVPTAGFLLEGAPGGEFGHLALDLVGEGLADAADAVHVLDLDLAAELLLALGADGDVAVAAELAFFHVGVADAAVEEGSGGGR